VRAISYSKAKVIRHVRQRDPDHWNRTESQGNRTESPGCQRHTLCTLQ